MKASLKRVLLVLLLYLALFEVIEQLAVTRRESWGELAQMSLFLLLAGGLIWTVLPAFSGQRLKAPHRVGLYLGYRVLSCTATYLYSWHVRPNVGLYREPLWVAQHPGFQKELQERIKRNRW
jgi:hypothetical protein